MLRHVQQRRVRSFDGTEIAYQTSGQGPTVVLANGLGGAYSTWRHQYRLFGQDYRIISWDYRGLYRSARPARLQTLELSHQVRDLEAILVAESVDRALFVGWSMGVQFNFEYYRLHPEQFVGMVVLNGVPGRPFETALRIPGMALLMPLFWELVKQASGLARRSVPAIANWRLLIPTLQRLGMVSATLDRQVFTDLAAEFATLDFEVYGATFQALGRHDAWDVVPQVKVPTLILAGSRDAMTPLSTAERMACTLPRGELVVLDGGTHYTAVELPDEVNAHLRRYLRRLGYGPLAV